jgi:hypothetical protein
MSRWRPDVEDRNNLFFLFLIVVACAWFYWGIISQ